MQTVFSLVEGVVVEVTSKKKSNTGETCLGEKKKRRTTKVVSGECCLFGGGLCSC